MKTVILSMAAAAFMAAAAHAGTPEETARTFFDAYLKFRTSGLPKDEEMRVFAPLLTPEIVTLLGAASAEQKEFQRKNPDEKPPWIEGALFSSLFEGVSAYRLGDVLVSGDKASIPVYWEYTEGGETSRWIDVVCLVRSAGSWQIADIFFAAPWDFRPGPSLRAVLSARKD
jgi:hypothetical protein